MSAPIAGTEVEFAVLGPLRVIVGGRPVAITSMRQRALLAELVLRAGHAVSHSRLIEVMWRDPQPRDPRAALQVQVMRLRRALGIAGRLVRTDGGAYRLDVDSDACDVHRFRALIRAAPTAPHPVEVLREALQLWRGDALADVPSEALAPAVTALEDERLDALERRIALDLDEGRHADVVGELTELVAQRPHREQFWVQLMTALARSGRQTEALAAFRDVRTRLHDELGIEPGPELRRAHAIVLAGTPGAQPTSGQRARPEPSTSWVIRRQLPPEVADFVGRAGVADAIVHSLLDQRAVPVVVISGLPGVGKSALAVHVAHRIRAEFPDGQWHLLLAGGSSEPRTSEQLLDSMLRSSGADPAALPDDLDSMSAMLRDRLADRRVLLILDDAANAAQVRHALPGSPGCAVIVTSRNQLVELTALNGARPFPLSTLTPEESRELLCSVIGSSRIDEDPETAHQIGALCGHLPLAVRIAAANLVHQPSLALDQYAQRLRRNRLDTLTVAGSPAVLRDAFAVSVAALPLATQRAFRLLGCLPGTDLSAEAASALLGLSHVETDQIIDGLCAANLLSRTSDGRYGMHDLVREHAAALANAGDPRDQAAARERLLTWYWQAVEDANAAADLVSTVRLRHPTADPNRFADRASALAWLERELANLTAAIVQSAVDKPRHFAWGLTDALRIFVNIRRHLSAWRTLIGPALAAAQSAGDPVAIAAMQHSAGQLALSSGDDDAARAWYQQAIINYRRGGLTVGEAVLLGNLGILSTRALNLAEAIQYLDGAVDAFRSAGHGDLAALTLANRSDIRLRLGQLDQAASDATAALELPGHRAHIVALVNRSAAHRFVGRLDSAYADAEAALELSRQLGGIDDLIAASLELARCDLYRGQYQQAVELADQALQFAAGKSSSAFEPETLIVRATAHRMSARIELAISTCHKAVTCAEQGARGRLPGALIALAGALYDNDELQQASTEAERARRLGQRASLRLDECRALGLLAAIHRDLGQSDDASRYAERAAALAAETGYAPPPYERYAPSQTRRRQPAETYSQDLRSGGLAR